MYASDTVHMSHKAVIDAFIMKIIHQSLELPAWNLVPILDPFLDIEVPVPD